MNILERYAAMDYGPAPEARNEADAWLAGRDFSKSLFIGGEWRAAVSGKTFEVLEPSSGKLLAKVSDAGQADIDAAVAAARKALPKWSALSGYGRAKVLYAIGRAMQRHQRLFAVLESIDNGKPIRESRDIDVPLAIRHFIHHAGWAQALDREFPGHKPAGVVGQIIPWNFPLLMAAWKLGPALACGNAVVLKPAEQTPLTALRLAELLQEAGLPDGVLNVVPGFGPTAGGALVKHPMVDKIAFTGSTEVGKEIHRETAGTLKRVSLELGGKSPNIVFADADVEAAVQGALMGVFFNQGQVCCAGTRLFVEQKMHDEFADALARHAGSIPQGHGIDPSTQIGPLVSKEQLDRVTGYLEIGKKEGARAIAGGERNTSPGLEGGYFVKPTVFTGVKNDMRIAQEEIFGPVVSVIPFKDEHDAVLQGNNTFYGLAAGVWTRDVSKAHRVARAIRAGTLWVNCYNVFGASAPFGGYKQSGYGRELGSYSLDLYTQIKTVWMKL